MDAPPITENQIEETLLWIQSMSLSRPPKNLTRDFSDGVLLAEIMRHSFPQYVQLHNYQPVNASAGKYMNWKTLNQKIFRKLGFQISRSDIEGIIGSVPGAVQRVLYMVYGKLKQFHRDNSKQNLTSSKSRLQMSPKKRNALIQQQKGDSKFARQLSSQLALKQSVIGELKETIQILETKIKKMQQLSKLKDAKIDSLMRKLDQTIDINNMIL